MQRILRPAGQHIAGSAKGKPSFHQTALFSSTSQTLLETEVQQEEKTLSPFEERLQDRARRALRTQTRRLERRKARERKSTIRSWAREHRGFENANVLSAVKEARQKWKEDWKLGPLRPNRAIGGLKDTYGALPRERLTKIQVPKHLRLPKEMIPFRQGDRVVVMRGPDKGKIGTVKEFNRDCNDVLLENMNMAWADTEAFSTMRTPTNPGRQETNLPYVFSDLRLVMRWEDPRDGREKDVIVDDIEFKPVREGDGSGRSPVNPWTLKPTYHRYVAGTNIMIEMSEDDLKTEKDPGYRSHDDDTKSDIIESEQHHTFTYPLVRLPMPPSVIDELRNPYAKTRTRHDEEWLRQHEIREQQKVEKEKTPEYMKTPTQVLRELQAQKRAQEKEAKKQEQMMLAEHLTRKIGEMVLKNAPKAPVGYVKMTAEERARVLMGKPAKLRKRRELSLGPLSL
ncbi:hypothetical protein BCR34DRAFT_564113 [Clohesyomyces aquaticus]|uniref:KOW domain-containing protein n=1 Tax=Clohesyomyces aquaticus TaxID=1231657 RepID=A0A1Y1ZPU9_9PLEO|nr:hypothetical protein BCR34DRAFT_564113 [Clohesyomyces aquaticus]